MTFETLAGKPRSPRYRSGIHNQPEQRHDKLCKDGRSRRHLGCSLRDRLPADAAVDAEVDLCDNGGEYFLKARLNVRLPGIGREVAQAWVDAAHLTCPYS